MTLYTRVKNSIFETIKSLIIVLPIAFLIRTFGYGLYQVPTGSMEVTMLKGELYFADKFTYLFSTPQRGDIISTNDQNFPYSKNRFMNIFQRYVYGPENWTKRIVGIPGDHVKGVMEDGHPVIYLNGEKLDQKHVNPYPLIATISNDQLHYRSYDPSKSYYDQPFYRQTDAGVRLAKRVTRYYDQPFLKEPYEPSFDRNGRNIDIFEFHIGDNQYLGIGDNRRNSYDCREWGLIDGQLIHGRIVFRIFSLDTQENWIVLDLLKHPFDIFTRIRWSRCLQRVY